MPYVEAISILLRQRVALFCWAAILLTGVWHDIALNSGKPYGEDAAVECAGVNAYNNGLDPYYVRNLKNDSNLPYTYLPVTLSLLKPLCSAGALSHEYYRGFFFLLAAILVFLLAGGGRTLHRNGARICRVGVLAVCGFSGFEWTVQTGNIAAIDGFFIALGIFFLMRARLLQQADDKTSLKYGDIIFYAVGVALLGFTASIKLVFAPVLLGLFFLPVSGRKKIFLLFVASISFMLPFVLSYVFYQELCISWINGILGHIPDQISPIKEGPNGSLYFIVSETFSFLGASPLLQNIGGWLGYGAVFGAIILSAVLTGYRLLKNKRDGLEQNPDFAFYMVYLTMFGIALCAPRIKDYFFFNLAIYVAALSMFLSNRMSVGCAFGTVVLPLLLAKAIPPEHLNRFNIANTFSALLCYVFLLRASGSVLATQAKAEEAITGMEKS
jgi:hypothetical protein